MAKVVCLEVVLKIVERCNIDCKYCYYINGVGSNNHKYPVYISEKIVDSIVSFLEGGCQKLPISTINFYLHGGEPLMLKKPVFDYLCKQLTSSLASMVKLNLNVQTNATLITGEWLELLSKHNVQIGISLDGPAEYNDKYRVDHKGHGTYSQVFKGIQLIKSFASTKNKGLSILSVINSDFSGKRIYHHFVHELGAKNIDFLLPDVTHDMVAKDSISQYGRFMLEVFSEWVKDDDPSIVVRTFNNLMTFLTDENHNLYNHNKENKTIAITINSDGSLAPEDTLRTAKPDWFESHYATDNISLVDFLNTTGMSQVEAAKVATPDACLPCQWRKFCNGGDLIHRYSKSTQFNNSSVMCEALKMLYSTATEYLVNQSHELGKIANALSG